MRCKLNRSAVSLIEVMIAMAILSTLALPLGMFLVEQMRGSSQLGDYHQILNLLEEKLETALAINFHALPPGETTDRLIETNGPVALDLRPIEISHYLVSFRMQTDLLPVSCEALKDAASSELQSLTVEDAVKRIELTAEWGDKQQHRLNLVSYRANL